MVRVVITLLVLLCSSAAYSAEFQTDDPLNAFVRREYPLGDDYFIKGNADTHIFRCILTAATEGFEGVALSEISIWGNRAGPWEIFRKNSGGPYVYAGTRNLRSTACLESCRLQAYLQTGRCQWRRGWPQP